MNLKAIKTRRTTGPIIDPVTRVELVGETLPSLCPHQWLAHHRKQRKLTEFTNNQSFTSRTKKERKKEKMPVYPYEEKKARSSQFTPNKAILLRSLFELPLLIHLLLS